METDRPGALYRTMVAFLAKRGADVEHLPEHISSDDPEEMTDLELVQYQRVLEATIDEQHPSMDRVAMRTVYVRLLNEIDARDTSLSPDDVIDQAKRVASLME